MFKTYFKPTDWNGYFPLDSCHHSQWLTSIPYSQFHRLRWNCTDIEVFQQQAEVFKTKLVQKGYRSGDLDGDIAKATWMSTLLEDNPKSTQDNKFRWSFFTAFSTQYKQIKKITNKHWKVLRNDRFLGPVLLERAGVIFRGAWSIQGEIAPNIIDSPKRVSFFQQCKGYYPYHRCNVCLHNIGRRRKKWTLLHPLSPHAIIRWSISPNVPLDI